MNINNVQQGYALLKKVASSAVTVAASSIKQAADVAKEVAKDVAEDLRGITVAKHYRLGEPIATSGPWTLYSATNKKPGAVFTDACVWIVNKKALHEGHSLRGGKPRDFEEFYAQQRRACSQMAKIKHPGVLRVLEPLEESSTQMMFITEPVLGTLDDVLSRFGGVACASEARRSLQLSQLEIKYGLVHLVETLQFLAAEARIVHCNLNKQSLVITEDGSWKLAGFAYATGLDAAGTATEPLCFEYNNGQPFYWEEIARPPLQYSAPELVGSWGGPSLGAKLSAACDVFSLALLAFELTGGRQALPVKQAVGEYRSRIQHLAGVDMAGVPPELQPALRGMLAMQPGARPPVGALTESAWFQEDVLLRSLRFLDSMLQRENLQKIAFLKDLAAFWGRFDGRMLRNKVLPPLLQEMRNPAVQLAAFPVVLAILEQQQQAEFMAAILPHMRPLFEGAQGDVALALVRHAHVFSRLMTAEALNAVMLPLCLRALDSPQPRLVEEALRNLPCLAGRLAYGPLKEALVPRVYSLSLRTTSAHVRLQALTLMGCLLVRLDKDEALRMLDTAGQITALDRTPSTLMGALAVAEATSRHWGPELTAQRVLPLLAPLLVEPGLSGPQFQQLLAAVRAMLDRIQHKRGSGGGGPQQELAAAAAAAAAPAASRPAGAGADAALQGWDLPTAAAKQPVSSSAAVTAGGSAGTSGGSNTWMSAASIAPKPASKPASWSAATSISSSLPSTPQQSAPSWQAGASYARTTSSNSLASSSAATPTSLADAADLFGGLGLTAGASAAPAAAPVPAAAAAGGALGPGSSSPWALRGPTAPGAPPAGSSGAFSSMGGMQLAAAAAPAARGGGWGLGAHSSSLSLSSSSSSSSSAAWAVQASGPGRPSGLASSSSSAGSRAAAAAGGDLFGLPAGLPAPPGAMGGLGSSMGSSMGMATRGSSSADPFADLGLGPVPRIAAAAAPAATASADPFESLAAGTAAPSMWPSGQQQQQQQQQQVAMGSSDWGSFAHAGNPVANGDSLI